MLETFLFCFGIVSIIEIIVIFTKEALSDACKPSYMPKDEVPMPREEMLLWGKMVEEIHSRSQFCFGEEYKKLKEDIRAKYKPRFTDELGYTPEQFDKDLDKFFTKNR